MNHWSVAGGCGLAALYESLFEKGHPYQAFRKSTPASIAAISLQDVLNFVQTYYRAANAIIVVGGAVPRVSLLDKVGAYFPVELWTHSGADPHTPVRGASESQKARVSSNSVPARMESSIHTASLPTHQRSLLMGWRLPSTAGALAVVAPMVAANLEASITASRMGTLWGRKWAGEPTCSYLPGEVNAAIVCNIPMDEEEAAGPIRFRVIRMLRKIRKLDLIDRNLLEGMFETILLTSSALVGPEWLTEETAQSTLSSDRPDPFSQTRDVIFGLRPDAFRRFVADYLTRSRVATVLVEPSLTALQYGDKDEHQYTLASDQKALTSLQDLSPEAVMAAVIPVELDALKEMHLKNGLKVILLPRQGARAAEATLLFRGGWAVEPKSGLCAFANYFNAGPDPTVREDVLYFTSISTHRNLKWMLRNLKRKATERFPRGNFGWRERRRLSLTTKHLDGQPREIWMRQVKEHLFPDHPLGVKQKSDSEVVSSFNQLSLKDYYAWNRSVYRPDNATLLIVGNFNRDATLKSIQKVFGAWTAKDNSKLEFARLGPPGESRARKILLFAAKGDGQTSLSLACQVGPHSEDTMQSLRVLEGYLSQEVFRRFREELGVSYTPQVGITLWSGGAARLEIDAVIRSDSVGLTAQTGLAVIEDVALGRIDEDVLALSQMKLARSSGRELCNIHQVMSAMRDGERFGFGRELMEQKAAGLAHTTSADLQKLMRRCVGREILGLGGDVTQISAQLEEQNLEYEVWPLSESGS